MNRWSKIFLCVVFFSLSCGRKTQPLHDDEYVLKKGNELFVKYGCAVCHSVEGKEIYGPALNGLFMKEVKVIRNGKEFILTANRQYLKKAIADPRYEKVADYRNKEMPLTQITDEDVEMLIEYLILLGNEKNNNVSKIQSAPK